MQDSKRPLIHQHWSDVLFLHYPVSPSRIQNLLPEGLECDTWEGRAYVSVVPFRMSRVRFHWGPTLPFSSLWELNLRTYVRCGNKRGVYFFTLDSTHRLGNWIARNVFALPYRMLHLEESPESLSVNYVFKAPERLGLQAQITEDKPEGSPELHRWLTERYFLFTPKAGTIYAGQVLHKPWELLGAKVEYLDEKLRAEFGVEEGANFPELISYARALDVSFLPFTKESL